MSTNSELQPERNLKAAETWPPAPTKQPKAPASASGSDGELTHCPHCRNRLLSQRSPICSWCGKPINDEKYLEKAAAERAAVDAQMRERLVREAEKPQKRGFIAKIAKTANSILTSED